MMGTSRHGLRITGAFAAVMGAVVLLSGFGRAFAQQPRSQVEIRAAFWRVGGGFETSLLINNTQPQQISVQVVVYDHAGRRIPAQAVELGPLASVDVDLGTLIGGRIGGYGQIALQHQGQTLDVAAQVIIRNRRRQLVFNQGLLLPGQHAGNHLVGVSDLGVSPASSLLAISNAGTQTRRVTVEAVLGNHRGSETAQITRLRWQSFERSR